MGLISEFRSSLENPQTPLSYPAEWLLDIFNGGRTDSGIRVSEKTALQVTTIWACCEIKGGAVGALDLRIFERVLDPDGRLHRRVAYDSDLWDLLADEPNPEMTSFTLRKTVQVHRMLWTNGYIEIQRDGANRPVALWPRNPARMSIRRATQPFLIGDELIRKGELFYSTTEGMETINVNPESPEPNTDAGRRAIHPLDMIHIPGLSLDGRIGENVVFMARNAIGLALATEKFGGKFFGNGAVGMGVFEVPTLLAPEDFERTKRSLQEAWGGENMLRPLLLEAGTKYTPTSVDPDKAQAIQTRDFQIIEICRAMNTPPHMVGVTEKTSRANTEQIGQEFLTFSLSPDLKAWEQELRRKLFPVATVGRSAGRKFGIHFDTWPLIMPSSNDLRQFIQGMIQFGVFEPNDARERLNMNPLDGPASSSTWMPVNMAPSEQLFVTPQSTNDGGNDGEGKDKKKPKGTGGMQQAYSRLFNDAFRRICARSKADELAFQRAFLPVLMSIGEGLEQFAAQEFNADANPDGFERSSFLAEYVKGMYHRFNKESWATANGKSDSICQRELDRAVKALAIEVYREVGTRAAKQLAEEQKAAKELTEAQQ